MVLTASRPHLHPLPSQPQNSADEVVPYSLHLFPDRLGISPEEFGRATGLGRTSTYLAIQRGEIPIKRIGRRLIIPLSALDAWFSQQDDPSAA